ncbi:MAG: hybrid sensor histidine kinase/response regulator [Cyclobacteriaceae bacterium]
MPSGSKTGIKSKIIFILMIAIGAIIAAGGFALFSLEKMLATVESIATPNFRVEIINNISNDLLRLNQYNNAYRMPEVPDAYSDYTKIALEIDAQLDTLKTLLYDDSVQTNRIDSVQWLMTEMLEGTDALAYAYKENVQNSFSGRVLRELSVQIDSSYMQLKDSTYIVHNSTAEIKISNYTLQALDSLSKTEKNQNESGFWSKMRHFFTRKENRNLDVLDTVVLVPEKQIDTLYTQSIDSVVVSSSEEIISSLRQMIQDFYREERRSQQNLSSMETAVNQKNAKLLEIIQSTFLELKNAEYLQTYGNLENAYNTSTKFKNVLTGIILFFMLAGLILMYLMLTDLKRAQYYQDQLLAEKEKSDRAVKIKQKFLATMSHEIRTPLTSIVGYSDLLENSNEYIKAIKRSSQHLLKTANEILDLAKIESGIIEINLEPVILQNLLEDVYLAFNLKTREKKLDFEFQIPAGETLVRTDPYRLNQVFYNLVHNAVKFTDEGSIEFKAEFITDNDMIHAHFVLKDTGIGISKEDQERIFEDYQQAGKSNKRNKGAGLGLGIVHKVVSLLGGELGLSSIPDQGTEIWLKFSFEQVSKNEWIRQKEFDFQSDLLSGVKILVVDDDPLILKLHQLILSGCGAEVHTTSDPENALELASKMDFQVAIFDIHMPTISGYDLCRKVKEIPGFSSKILAATADVLTKSMDNNRDCFDEILYKPVHKNELIGKIASILDIPIKNENKIETTHDNVFSNGNNVPYDLVDIEKFTLGDADMVKDIVKQFYNETQNDLNLLKGQIEKPDPSLVTLITHKLASRFAQFKISELSELSRKIELNTRKENMVNSDNLNQLITEADEINARFKLDFNL